MTSAPDDLREKMGDAIRYWLAFGSTARRTVEDVLAAIEAAGWNLVPMEDVVGNMDISDPTTPQAAASAIAREGAAFRAGAEAMRKKAADVAVRFVNKFADDEISDCSMLLRLSPMTANRAVFPIASVKLGAGRASDFAADPQERAEGIERVKASIETEGKFVKICL